MQLLSTVEVQQVSGGAYYEIISLIGIAGLGLGVFALELYMMKRTIKSIETSNLTPVQAYQIGLNEGLSLCHR